MLAERLLISLIAHPSVGVDREAGLSAAATASCVQLMQSRATRAGYRSRMPVHPQFNPVALVARAGGDPPVRASPPPVAFGSSSGWSSRLTPRFAQAADAPRCSRTRLWGVLGGGRRPGYALFYKPGVTPSIRSRCCGAEGLHGIAGDRCDGALRASKGRLLPATDDLIAPAAPTGPASGRARQLHQRRAVGRAADPACPCATGSRSQQPAAAPPSPVSTSS